MKLLIINGPNLNLLGQREKGIYGERTFESYLEELRGRFPGVTIDCYQSNSEGDIVTRIQHAYGTCDAIVINAAAYTHTSVAILDALKAVGLPTVEVHLTDINSREDFRRLSYVSMYAEKTVCGKGFDGYSEAIVYLAEKYA